MNSIINNIHDTIINLRKYQGLVPTMFPKNLGTVKGKVRTTYESRFAVSFGHPYSRSTNWSYAFSQAVMGNLDDSTPRARYQSSISSCFSGRGRFLWKDRLLVEFASVLHILAMEIEDPLERKIYMVSDQFDTPKCPVRYKAMRKHWRKVMYGLIDHNVKIVKVPHSFLQQFKMQYNYVPKRAEIAQLEGSILRLVKETVQH